MTHTVDEPKLYVPGLAGLYRGLAPYGYVVIRFAAGLILVPHGWAKLFGGLAPTVADKVLTPLGVPAPHVTIYLLAVLESVGGLCLAFGLFTRAIAAMLVVEMAVITFGVLFSHGFGAYEHTLLLMCVYLGIFMRGADRCSIDRMIGREF